MNFALDLAAGAIAGVGVDVRGLVARPAAIPTTRARPPAAIDNAVFGGTLSAASLQAASRVDTRHRGASRRGSPGLLLAGPEMQVR